MKIRKIISLFIISALISGSLPFTVSAFTDKKIQYSEVMMPALYDSPDNMSGSISALEALVDIDTFRQTIIESVAECKTEIPISSLDVPVSAAQSVADFIWYNTPEAFNVQGISYSYYADTLHSLVLSYRSFADTKTEYADCMEEFMSAADKMLQGIEYNDSLTDVQKALLLHDRLAMWTEYDYVSSSVIKHTAYGAFGKRASVCQGYAMAYMYLLQRVGIKNYYCSSETLNHGWNIIYINNKPYHVDVTWDDKSWGGSGRGFIGRVDHDNFLRSTTGIKSTGHNAYDFDSSPTDTTYDSYFWQNSTTAFQLVSGEIYYIDNTAEKLKRYSDKKVLCDVSDDWYASNGGIWFSDYACLSSAGNDLFYSKADGVYKYSIKDNTSKKIYSPTLSKYYSVFGFTYEDGYLICDINNTPNSAQTLSQLKSAYSDISRDVTGIEIKTLPSKTTFNMGDSSDFSGLTIKVKYSDNTSQILSSGFSCTGFSSSSLGTKTIQVSYEGYSVSFSVTIVCGHKNKTNTAALESTCSAEGYTSGVYCNDCSKYISGHTKTAINSSAHRWNNGTVTTVPTCSEEGTKTYVCKYNSSHKKTEAVAKDKNNHKNTVSKNGVLPTCTTEGYTAGVYCNDCRTYISGHTQLAIDSSAHKWDDGKITTTATCSVKGIRTYTCQYNSSHTKTENLGFATDNHVNVINISETAPKCTEKGYTAGVYCDDCNKYLSGHMEIPATNHKNKHPVEAVAPDCTVPGCTAGVFCPDCETYLEVSGEIPVDPSAHKWDSGKITTTATCSVKGVKTYTCQHNSSHTKTEELAFAPLNHVNTKTVAATPATFTSVGYTEGVYCNDCKKYISGHNEIPVLTSEFTDNDEIILRDSTVMFASGKTVQDILKQAASGTVIKDKDGKPVSDSAIAVTGMTLVLPSGKVCDMVCPGDVNSDGKITAADARFVLRASVGLEKIEAGSAVYKAADRNNMNIAAADARLILRASVGLENQKDWVKG